MRTELSESAAKVSNGLVKDYVALLDVGSPARRDKESTGNGLAHVAYLEDEEAESRSRRFVLQYKRWLPDHLSSLMD